MNNKDVYVECIKCGDNVHKGHSKHMNNGRICLQCFEESMIKMNHRNLSYYHRESKSWKTEAMA